LARPTLRSNRNLVFQCAYHVVWCTKYRRPVLREAIQERLRHVIAETIQDSGAWLVEREPTGALVGIDRGVVNSIATSDGQFWPAPCLWAKEVERARRLQKRLSRQSKGSNRRQRTKRSLGRLGAKESDRRRDWVEKTTTGLVRDHDLIAVERLQIRNLVRSARGTVAEPGHNVRAKAALNRAILGQCWASSYDG
jgi:transposase